jgi:hypothetical protein
VIVLLSGEIIYLSPIDTGCSDQTIWNNEELRKHYENKEYGILGDGGLSFNWKIDTVEITSAKPKARPRKTKWKPKANLPVLEKSQNTTILKYCVVVENIIGHIKDWQILAGQFCHYTASKQKQPISLDNVLWVCCGLTNQKIKRKPLCTPNWQPHNHLALDIEQMTWLFQNVLNLE